jgi:chemotaxis protein MotB
MHTARLALAAVALSALALTGCSDKPHRQTKAHADAAEARIADLERQLEEANTNLANTRMGKGVSDAGVVGQVEGATVDKTNWATRITIENKILFRPGRAELSSEAKGVLSRVVALLKQRYSDHDVLVIGHTDNQQITRSKDSWDDNWDLSGGRSRVVLHYLKDKGIPASHLGFAGYADQKPRTSNGNEAGRSKNRRVEIIVIPRGAQTIDETGSDKPAKADKADVAEGS